MHIENINSSWVLAQQAKDQGTKAVQEAEGFADELKRAREYVAHPHKQATDPTGKLTPEELAYDKKLREACQGFEAMFLNMMYREMRSTVPENSLFGDSNADKILQDMRDTEMVNQMAKAGGVGLADVLYKQLTMEDKAKADMSARAADMSREEKVVRT
ncbi:rod-binding protein [uncultured Anaerovibrio sp.]|jgi:flagellar protein FlgJ|uniref:rod-binding protein n=1 Tax=uncultured Anaerovibrio sp. TaxID=361586 RepID=UPI00262B1BDA|nr:rod-binding protein [uncultured Anaerovibrio sp.]